MSIIDDRILSYEESKENVDSGKYNCIPFSDAYPKFSRYLPGVIPGVYYIVTANSGIGKTQLTKHMFVRTPYKFIKEHPECGIKLKILYFALEESKEEFWDTMVVARLAEEHGIYIDTLQLNSMYADKDLQLTDEILVKVKECRDYIAELEEYIEVIDSVSNPTGIYKHCRSYSEKVGTHVWVEKEFTKKGVITKEKVYSHYEPNDPDLHVIVIVDTFNLLAAENKAPTLHAAMSKMSIDYARKQITKHWRWSFVNVQQQNAASESLDHFKANKLEPSLDSLGDNKLTARDSLVVIGLFAPDRYQLKNHNGHDITKLKDNYRGMVVLKNRIGRPNAKIALFFDGAANDFKELPSPVDTKGMEKVYNYINHIKK